MRDLTELLERCLTCIGACLQIIHMANDSSLIPSSQDAAADPDFVAGSGLASATPSSTMRGALEAMHSVDLGHPNIVQTYKSTQRLVQVRARGPARCAPCNPVLSEAPLRCDWPRVVIVQGRPDWTAMPCNVVLLCF